MLPDHNSPEGMDRFWANVPAGYFEERQSFYQMVAKWVRDTTNLGITSVLDVGCAGGMMLKTIDDELVVVTQHLMVGMDYSIEAIRLAKRNYPDATYILGDITSKDWWGINLEFDLILCTQTLEHIQDYNAALRHMAGMRSMYGEVIITVPDGARDLFPHHVNRWDLDAFEKLMHVYGGKAYRMGSLHLIGVI